MKQVYSGSWPRKIVLLFAVLESINGFLFTWPATHLADDKLEFSQPKRRSVERMPLGNGCPVTAPWPCQQPSYCLSFAFVCDGEIDCPDGYDENPRLCVAKNRPAVTLLEGFISKYRDWLIPKFLGNGTSDQIAYNLAISQNVADYARNMQLDSEQTENLRQLMNEVMAARQFALLMLGMPLQSWAEVFTVLRPIARGLID